VVSWAERPAFEFEFRVSLDEQVPAGMDAAGPGFQRAFLLEFRPILGFLEYVDVRFVLPLRGIAGEVLRDYTVIKLRLDRDRCGDEAVKKVIDEIGGLRVLPSLRANAEGGFSERLIR